MIIGPWARSVTEVSAEEDLHELPRGKGSEQGLEPELNLILGVMVLKN